MACAAGEFVCTGVTATAAPLLAEGPLSDTGARLKGALPFMVAPFRSLVLLEIVLWSFLSPVPKEHLPSVVIPCQRPLTGRLRRHGLGYLYRNRLKLAVHFIAPAAQNTCNKANRVLPQRAVHAGEEHGSKSRSFEVPPRFTWMPSFCKVETTIALAATRWDIQLVGTLSSEPSSLSPQAVLD